MELDDVARGGEREPSSSRPRRGVDPAAVELRGHPALETHEARVGGRVGWASARLTTPGRSSGYAAADIGAILHNG